MTAAPVPCRSRRRSRHRRDEDPRRGRGCARPRSWPGPRGHRRPPRRRGGRVGGGGPRTPRRGRSARRSPASTSSGPACPAGSCRRPARSATRSTSGSGPSRSPSRSACRRATGVPTSVENDVNAAAFGASTVVMGPLRDLAYLSVGTGLAAGLISTAALRRGAHGVAGEIGHLPVDPEGPLASAASGVAWRRSRRERPSPAAGPDSGRAGRPTCSRAAAAGDARRRRPPRRGGPSPRRRRS